jgi:hypothetical protein
VDDAIVARIEREAGIEGLVGPSGWTSSRGAPSLCCRGPSSGSSSRPSRRSGRAPRSAASHRTGSSRLLEPFGAVEVDRKPRKQEYYAGATFGVSTGGRELVEGGFVDWTQRLLGDRKERLLISGTGLDLLSTIEGATRR